MGTIGIVGSGNVGANAAFFIAEKAIEDVLLFDTREGLPAGKSLDMMEAAPIRKYRSRIRRIGDIGEAAGSEAIIIAAGRTCPVGGKSAGLLGENWETVREITGTILKVSPGSVLVVATEPVDLLVGLIARTFAVPRERLLGLGGILDSTRLKAALSVELGISTENITAMVIGRHTDEMIAPVEYARVAGIPISQLMPEADIGRLMDGVRNADRLMAELSECPGSYYSPSASAAEAVEAIHRDMKRILPVSVELRGEYGIKGVALSLPCVIGAGGVERVLTPDLSRAERDALKGSAERMAKEMEGLLP